jgi:hypothetical protein
MALNAMKLIKQPDWINIFPIVFLMLVVEEFRHGGQQLVHRLDAQELSIKSLIDQNASQLLGLRECLDDLARRIQRLSEHDILQIEHIGLDMTQAWQYVRDGTLDRISCKELTYRLLLSSRQLRRQNC